MARSLAMLVRSRIPLLGSDLFNAFRMRFCGTSARRGPLAGQIRRRPAFPHTKNIRYVSEFAKLSHSIQIDHLGRLVRAGDLIPRHMKVFKNNEFFAGLSIPEPDVRESLEAKMPRDFSAEAMDFLKVSRARDSL